MIQVNKVSSSSEDATTFEELVEIHNRRIENQAQVLSGSLTAVEIVELYNRRIEQSNALDRGDMSGETTQTSASSRITYADADSTTTP